MQSRQAFSQPTSKTEKIMINNKSFLIRLLVSILFWLIFVISFIKLMSDEEKIGYGIFFAINIILVIIESVLRTSYKKKKKNGELSNDGEMPREIFLDKDGNEIPAEIPREIILDKDGNDISSECDIHSDNVLLNVINDVVTETSLPMIENINSMIDTFNKDKEYIMAKENGKLPHDKYNQFLVDKAKELHEREEEQKSKYVYEDDDAAMDTLTTEINGEITPAENGDYDELMPVISTENSEIQEKENKKYTEMENI